MTDEPKTSAGGAPDEVEYITAPKEGDAKPEETAPPCEAEAPGSETVRILRDRLRKRSAELRALRKGSAELERLRAENAELAKLREENAELRDQYLRKLADTDNLRKRFEREKSEHRQYALSELLLELLDVLDNFERALESPGETGEGDTFRSGVELIHRMFQNVLLRKGVRPLESSGRTFDPAFHHAMTVEESDEVSEPEVAEVLQKGYMLHNRLLRPALVKVLVPRKTVER